MKHSTLLRTISLLLLVLFLFSFAACGEPKPSDDTTAPVTDPTDDTTAGADDTTAEPEPPKELTLEEALTAVKDIQPTVTELPEYDELIGDSRIHAIFYSSLPYNDHDTKVFAYYAIPEGASADAPVPAVILIPWINGNPWIEWVQHWLDAGYAVLGIDPEQPRMPSKETAGEWVEFDENEFHLRHAGFGETSYDYKDHWLYYSVADAILANNILRADERIASDKIGLSAFSLGTTPLLNALVYDDRFAFGAPVCGSGYLSENRGTSSGRFVIDPQYAEMWDPSSHFDKIKCPVLIAGAAKETFYSSDTESKSAAALENGTLSLSFFLAHAERETCFINEPIRFADSVCKGAGQAFCEFTKQDFDADALKFYVDFTVPEDMTITDVKLCYSDTPFGTPEEFRSRPSIWRGQALEKNDANSYEIDIPETAAMFYVEITGSVPAAEEGKTMSIISSTYEHVLTYDRPTE